MTIVALLVLLWLVLTVVTALVPPFDAATAAYFWLCELFAFCVLMPLGWILVGIACYYYEWTYSPNISSIKPLPNRKVIDTWDWYFMRLVYGNPEDGVSGIYAYGPSWPGAYNAPRATRWRAFKWSGLRNWAAGFNYLTWLWPGEKPPVIIKAYTVFGKQRQLKIGWQQLPTSDGWVGPYKERMVCSA